MRRQKDGRRDGGTEVWREAAQLCPPSPLPSRARIEVPQCRPPVPEIHTSPGVPRCFFFFFLSPPKEKEATRAATCTARRLQRRFGRCKTRRRFSLFGVLIPFFWFFFCSRLSRLLQAPTLPGSLPPSLAADESCTCCIRTERGRESEQAQDLSPCPPLPSSTPPLLAPSSSLDGSLSPFLSQISPARTGVQDHGRVLASGRNNNPPPPAPSTHTLSSPRHALYETSVKWRGVGGGGGCSAALPSMRAGPHSGLASVSSYFC